MRYQEDRLQIGIVKSDAFTRVLRSHGVDANDEDLQHILRYSEHDGQVLYRQFFRDVQAAQQRAAADHPPSPQQAKQAAPQQSPTGHQHLPALGPDSLSAWDATQPSPASPPAWGGAPDPGVLAAIEENLSQAEAEISKAEAENEQLRSAQGQLMAELRLQKHETQTQGEQLRAQLQQARADEMDIVLIRDEAPPASLPMGMGAPVRACAAVGRPW